MKINRYKTFLLNVTTLMMFSDPSSSETLVNQNDQGVRSAVWSVAFVGKRHSLKGGDGNELIGNSFETQLGTGYIAKSWYLNGSVNFILGPHEPTRNGQINVDYLGTGFTGWWGYSAQEKDIRTAEGSYGFALGLNYADIVGRAIGRRKSEKDLSIEEPIIEDYIMRVNEFSILPAIFFCWLNEARPKGNAPELLMTRIEGYFLTLGFSMPILTTYKARYENKRIKDDLRKEKGNLTGYAVFINFTALLGV